MQSEHQAPRQEHQQQEQKNENTDKEKKKREMEEHKEPKLGNYGDSFPHNEPQRNLIDERPVMPRDDQQIKYDNKNEDNVRSNFTSENNNNFNDKSYRNTKRGSDDIKADDLAEEFQNTNGCVNGGDNTKELLEQSSRKDDAVNSNYNNEPDQRQNTDDSAALDKDKMAEQIQIAHDAYNTTEIAVKEENKVEKEVEAEKGVEEENVGELRDLVQSHLAKDFRSMEAHHSDVIETKAATTKRAVSLPHGRYKVDPAVGARRSGRGMSVDELIEEMRPRCRKLHEIEDFSTSEASEHLRFLRVVSGYGRAPEIQNQLGMRMSELNVPELFQKVWRRHFTQDFFSDSETIVYTNMADILTVLCNMTEKCVTLCKHEFNVRLYQDVLSFLGSTKFHDAFSTNTAHPRSPRLVIGLLRVVYNMVQNVTKARQPFRDSGAVQIILPYRSSPSTTIACQTLLLLAYIIDEKENKSINSDLTSFKFLVKVLRETLDSGNATTGFTSLQIAAALNRYAADDSNKSKIIEAGALPLYVKMLGERRSETEQTVAAEGLWVLAFKCREAILKEPGCVEAQKYLIRRTHSQTLQQYLKGVLWILQNKHKLIPDQCLADGSLGHRRIRGRKTSKHVRERQAHKPLGVDRLAVRLPQLLNDQILINGNNQSLAESNKENVVNNKKQNLISSNNSDDAREIDITSSADRQLNANHDKCIKHVRKRNRISISVDMQQNLVKGKENKHANLRTTAITSTDHTRHASHRNIVIVPSERRPGLPDINSEKKPRPIYQTTMSQTRAGHSNHTRSNTVHPAQDLYASRITPYGSSSLGTGKGQNELVISSKATEQKGLIDRQKLLESSSETTNRKTLTDGDSAGAKNGLPTDVKTEISSKPNDFSSTNDDWSQLFDANIKNKLAIPQYGWGNTIVANNTKDASGNLEIDSNSTIDDNISELSNDADQLAQSSNQSESKKPQMDSNSEVFKPSDLNIEVTPESNAASSNSSIVSIDYHSEDMTDYDIIETIPTNLFVNAQSPTPAGSKPPSIVESLADSLPVSRSSSVTHSRQHLFISYQWNSKKTVLKLRDRLKAAGYNVWVDVDNMAGSVLEAMAEAVENAAVVLVGLTQNYKESPNCRTEAEYAFRLKKEVVPVRLEKGYQPDGWLGALVGSKLVHDLSGGVNDRALSDLFRDIGDRGRSVSRSSTPKDTLLMDREIVEATGLSNEARSSNEVSLTQWTEDHVTDWLDRNQLTHKRTWFSEFSGSMLMELVYMRRDAPEFFYSLLQHSNFSLTDILKLTKAFKDL